MDTNTSTCIKTVTLLLLKRTCLLLVAALVIAAGLFAEEKANHATQDLMPDGRTAPRAAAGSGMALRAREFPLSAVKLLDGPFRQAMETDKAYLLRLEPDRLLAGFRREAGLPKKAEPYGGWETIPETGRYSLAGQALGHYLSALSLMSCATGDA